MTIYHDDWEEAALALGARQNRPLSKMTTFQTGGAAAWSLRPRSYEDIRKAVLLCERCKVPYYLIGRGSNLLFPDEGYDGLIIRMDRPLHAPVNSLTRITACAATQLSLLARYAVAQRLSGLERLCGIPGTLGGAIAMNAGAYGGEIADVLTRVHILRNGKQEWVDVERASMTYRYSPFHFPDCIVLEAELSLHADDGDAERVMHECLRARRDKQPLNYPSAGSTFKRPQGQYAGTLIEQCGLKGYRVGGASVSRKHAGFVINHDHATSADIRAVIAHVQEVVQRRTGVLLEPEVKIIQGE